MICRAQYKMKTLGLLSKKYGEIVLQYAACKVSCTLSVSTCDAFNLLSN